jgi:hypothetical protein
MNDADLLPDRPGNIFVSSDQVVKIGGVLAAPRREKRKEIFLGLGEGRTQT